MGRVPAWRIWVVAPALLWVPAPAYSAQAKSGPVRAAPGATASLAAARRYLQADDLERAEASLRAALELNPASAEAYYLLGVVAERRKDLPRAAALFAEAIRYAPEMAEAHDRRGFVLGQLGDTPGALTEFARAVELAPALFDAQYHLGATRWWTKDLQARFVRAAGGGSPPAAPCRSPLLPWHHTRSGWTVVAGDAQPSRGGPTEPSPWSGAGAARSCAAGRR